MTKTRNRTPAKFIDERENQNAAILPKQQLTLWYFLLIHTDKAEKLIYFMLFIPTSEREMRCNLVER